jgi:DNA-binding response OmpR family regulator
MAQILIVEDEERIASFVAKGLRAEGHHPTVVGDGPGGLDEALSGRYDLLVLDIGLPGMDGFELLDHVWGYDFDPGSNVVDVYVGYLRRKVGADTIATVRGVGYRFRPA